MQCVVLGDWMDAFPLGDCKDCWLACDEGVLLPELAGKHIVEVPGGVIAAQTSSARHGGHGERAGIIRLMQGSGR